MVQLIHFNKCLDLFRKNWFWINSGGSWTHFPIGSSRKGAAEKAGKSFPSLVTEDRQKAPGIRRGNSGLGPKKTLLTLMTLINPY